MPPKKTAAAPSRKAYRGTTRRLLLAFDIGTTFSGVSYSILDPGKVPEIRTLTRYPGQERAGGDSKIPTVIYYNAQGIPVRIGADTLKEGIEVDAENGGWFKAHWFKLHLRPSQGAALNPGAIPVPPLPPNKTVVDVFTDFTRHLHGCAKNYISETHGDKLWESVENNIIYVLTHPNGWGGQQQALMRRAATNAGLVPDTPEGAARVSFVTEGEASLHFCLSNGLTDDSDAGVLIVDAGGGTVDLTAYKRTEDKSFIEIAIPKCYFQGSAYVTMRAERHFRQLLHGSQFTADVPAITKAFDRNTKHVFKRDDEPHYIAFGSARDQDPALKIRQGRLAVPGAKIAQLFEPSVSCIIVAIKKQCVNAHEPIKTVFLVGGFSASSWLYEKVREGVQCLGITVSRPDTHVNKAVSDGAVSFYLDGVVSSRVSRATYGIEVYEVYDVKRGDHVLRAGKMQIHATTREPVLYGSFSPILPRNVMVKATKEFRKPFWAQSESKEAFASKSLVVYSYNGIPAEGDESLWIADDAAKFPAVCTVKADTSKVAVRERRNAAGKVYFVLAFEVVLMFGLTELQAQIAYQEDGEEKRGPATVIFEGAVFE